MVDFLDLLISRYTFLSTAEKSLVKDVAGDQRTLEAMSLTDITSITGRMHRIRDWSFDKSRKEAEKSDEMLAGGRIKGLCFYEKAYPAQLSAIYNPPYIIYYRGRLPDLHRPLVSIVGTRMPTGKGLDSSFEMGLDFGRQNIAVVSGLAAGIDSAAHSGNTAGGEKSIAVLGCGPDRIYPASNRKTALDMLENGGALLSEYPPGTDPQRFHFPERNRIISGLSRAVIVVEAPGKSGALITADFALEQGRDLYIHSDALHVPGNRARVERLVFDGAPVIDGAGDVLADWNLNQQPELLADAVVNEPVMEISEAGSRLADMLSKELQGYTVKFNGKYFRSVCNESSYFVNS